MVEINSSDKSNSGNITGLLPNTEYLFQWCGRKASNSVDGYSNNKIIKTLGDSILNIVSNIYVDVSSPKLTLKATYYSTTFYHKLILSKDNKEMIFNLGWCQESDNTHIISLTTDQIKTFIIWIGPTNLIYNDINVILITYSNNTYSSLVGESSDLINIINLIIRKENTQPTLTVGGYQDINNSSIVITNNNTYIIPSTSSQTASNVRINIIVGT